MVGAPGRDAKLGGVNGAGARRWAADSARGRSPRAGGESLPGALAANALGRGWLAGSWLAAWVGQRRQHILNMRELHALAADCRAALPLDRVDPPPILKRHDTDLPPGEQFLDSGARRLRRVEQSPCGRVL